MMRLLFILLALFTVLISVIWLIRLVIYFIRRKHFPRGQTIVVVISLIMCSLLFIYIQYFFTFDKINRTYMQEGPVNESPTKQFLAKAYYEPYGGAAGGVNVWVEITDYSDDVVRVIYYADAQEEVNLNWEDEKHLKIKNEGTYQNSNFSVVLDVTQEIYHGMGLACQSVLLKDKYKNCYQNEQ